VFSLRRSFVWWVAALLFAGMTWAAWVAYGMIVGIGLSMIVGAAALAAYWKVRD
jgi:hypothetical protein